LSIKNKKSHGAVHSI